MGVSFLAGLVALQLLIGSGSCMSFGHANAFQGLPDDFALPEIVEQTSKVEGKTASNVVIDQVVSYPEEGKSDIVVLRNVGGQTADIAGWQLSDAEASTTLTFGDGDCPQTSLAPTAKLEVGEDTGGDGCSYAFSVGFRDSVTLKNKDGDIISRVAWDASKKGTTFRRLGDGTFTTISEKGTVLDILESLGDYSVFLAALRVTGLDKKIAPTSDPEFEGTKKKYLAPTINQVDPQFPNWFGFELDRSTLTPPPPPPVVVVEEGVPQLGPYTIVAPTDAAFYSMRQQIAGLGQPALSVSDLLLLPELEDIVLYHILPGLWTSDLLQSYRAIGTAKGVDVVAFADAAMGEGKYQFHDSCLDKPTPDPYSCKEQVEFGKCDDPFMSSPLAAAWRGGFCELSCKRCTCDFREGAMCGSVDIVDIMAVNGVIHSLDRTLFPPPKFEKPSALSASSESNAVTGELSKGTRDEDGLSILQDAAANQHESVSSTG